MALIKIRHPSASHDRICLQGQWNDDWFMPLFHIIPCVNSRYLIYVASCRMVNGPSDSFRSAKGCLRETRGRAFPWDPARHAGIAGWAGPEQEALNADWAQMLVQSVINFQWYPVYNSYKWIWRFFSHWYLIGQSVTILHDRWMRRCVLSEIHRFIDDPFGTFQLWITVLKFLGNSISKRAFLDGHISAGSDIYCICECPRSSDMPIFFGYWHLFTDRIPVWADDLLCTGRCCFKWQESCGVEPFFWWQHLPCEVATNVFWVSLCDPSIERAKSRLENPFQPAELLGIPVFDRVQIADCLGWMNQWTSFLMLILQREWTCYPQYLPNTLRAWVQKLKESSSVSVLIRALLATHRKGNLTHLSKTISHMGPHGS